jgi:hypothetical protein
MITNIEKFMKILCTDFRQVVLKEYHANSCILMTRLGMLGAEHLGWHAEPLQTYVRVLNRAAFEIYDRNKTWPETDPEVADEWHEAGGFMLETHQLDDNGIGAYFILRIAGHICDPSSDQFYRPHHNLAAQTWAGPFPAQFDKQIFLMEQEEAAIFYAKAPLNQDKLNKSKDWNTDASHRLVGQLNLMTEHLRA